MGCGSSRALIVPEVAPATPEKPSKVLEDAAAEPIPAPAPEAEAPALSAVERALATPEEFLEPIGETGKPDLAAAAAPTPALVTAAVAGLATGQENPVGNPKSALEDTEDPFAPDQALDDLIDELAESQREAVPVEDGFPENTTPETAPISVPLCATCGAPDTDKSFIRDSDKCLYCHACWEDYYGEPPPKNEPLIALSVRQVMTYQELEDLWRTHYTRLDESTSRMEEEELDQELIDGYESEEICEVNMRLSCSPQVVGSSARKEYFSQYSDLQANDRIGDRYILRERIGAGNFSVSYRAEDEREGCDVCLKIEDSATLQHAMDKVLIHRRLAKADPDFTYFPCLYETFFVYERFISAEELLEGEHLWKIVERDPTYFRHLGRIQGLARTMLEALACLAKAKVIHCDVKPDNIMRLTPAASSNQESEPDSFRYRLLDFGCSRLDKVDPMFALKENGAGHIGHSSPEMLLRKPVTHKNDVFALGVTLAELYTGKMIWAHGENESEVLAKFIGLLGLVEGLPFHVYQNAGFRLEEHMHISGFPVRQAFEVPHSSPPNMVEVLQPSSSPDSWGLANFLGTEDKPFLQFMAALLEVDPRKRPSASEALQHTFLTSAFEGSQDDLG